MSDNGENAREPQVGTSLEGETAQGAVTTGTPASPGSGKVMRRALPRTTRDTNWASGSSIGPAVDSTPADPDPSAVHAAAEEGLASPGGALPHRGQLEGAFGLDLSSIIAHTGPEAQDSAAAMGAGGYATGNHVVVPPDAPVGLVAHEVTHVLQQQQGVHQSGGVDGGASDPLEQEADAVGAAVERGDSVAGRFAAPGAGGASRSVQRDTKKPPAKGQAKEKELTEEEKTELLKRARIDRATTGATLAAKRWTDKFPALFGDLAVPLDLPIPRFKQDVYNFIAVDRTDLSPIDSVLAAPGREAYSRAFAEAKQENDQDVPYFGQIMEAIDNLVQGGQIGRNRTRLIAHHAMLRPGGKRAIAEVPALGIKKLNDYWAGPAHAHGKLEDEHLGAADSWTEQPTAQAAIESQGSVYRPLACQQLLNMLRGGAPPLPDSPPAPVTEQKAEISAEVQGKADELKKAIEAALATVVVSTNGVPQMPLPELTKLQVAIDSANLEGVRELVFADKALMGRLAVAVDPSTAKGLLDRLDPIERLYQECEGAKDASEPKGMDAKIKVARFSGAWSDNLAELIQFKPQSAVFEKLRGWLKARAGKDKAPLRQRVQDHTKLKDNYIDRLPPDENRKIYRLIHRGSEDATAEDKVHEAAELKQPLAMVLALRELASTDPVRLKALEKDLVFRTAASSMNTLVDLPDGQKIRPWHLCLVLWGLEPGNTQETDPGTVKLTEINATGNKEPLNINERMKLEGELLVPCVRELKDEIDGKHDGEEYTYRADEKMRRTRRLGRRGDPQAIQNILVSWERKATQADFIELLQREHIVFGREIERRFLELYDVDLRNWIYDNAGPVNRSGANRVLGSEQGASVGMFNGKMMMAGEMDKAGKMTLQQALREHTWQGRPLYEWASVSSRAIAKELGNKDKLLAEWDAFKVAIDENAGELRGATGFNVRAIDLLRNAYMEHSGHFVTRLEAKWKNKQDELATIKERLGITANVDVPPDGPPPTVAEQAERMYGTVASILFNTLSCLHPTSDQSWYMAAGVAMQSRFLPRVPDDPNNPAAPAIAPGQEGHTVEERPPKSFNAYYRVHYGATPDLHAAAVLRAMGEARAVTAEEGARLLNIDAGLVTGAWKTPEEKPTIGPHNRHLVRASFSMEMAAEKAAQIWKGLHSGGRVDLIQTALAEHTEEEQALIRAEFRRLSGGFDLSFYIRQMMLERAREQNRLKEDSSSVGVTDLVGVPKSSALSLAGGRWGYQVVVGTRLTEEGDKAAGMMKIGGIQSASSDSELEQMLSISTSGNLDVRTRLRAAVKRDAWSEIKTIVDELTVEERKIVLADGELMNSIFDCLEQFDDERVYKILTGQGDLADRLFSRSHGGSWSERKLWGGTDEAGMRRDIKLYLRQLNLKHNADVRGQVTRMMAQNPGSPPPPQEQIDKEVTRRVLEACIKLASNETVDKILKSELEAHEYAEMKSMIQNGTGEARDWAVVGGAGKDQILADIRGLSAQEKQAKLNDPNYMRLLGQRLREEKDYRDAVNALREGEGGGNGLSKLDEVSRSKAQADGSSASGEKTLETLTTLSQAEFEALQANPALQVQVMAALKPEQQAIAREYLAGSRPGKMKIETAGLVSDEQIARGAGGGGGGGGGAVTQVVTMQAQSPQTAPVGADGKPVSQEEAQKQAEAALAAKKEAYVRYIVHQSIHRLGNHLRSQTGWSLVLEQAVAVYRADLPAIAAEGKKDPTQPREIIWTSVAPHMASFAAFHDQAKNAGQMTLQAITGAQMTGVLRAAVLGQVDPSDALVESLITTKDESAAVEATLRVSNPALAMEKFGPPGPGPLSKKPKDHMAREEELKEAVSAASDQHIAKNWTTYSEKPPGGEAAHTLKARYEEYRKAFKEAQPTLEAARKPRPKPAEKPAPTAPPSNVDVKPGASPDAAIDAAASAAKADVAPPPTTALGPLGGDKPKAVQDMELARGRFLEFRVTESSLFEAMLRQFMGDDRGLTPDGTFNPNRTKDSISKNKRYNNLVEALLLRATQMRPEAIAAVLGMDPHDLWLLKSGFRDEVAQMALSQQKNLRFSGAQRAVGSSSLEEKEALDVTTYMLYRTFADATSDYKISGDEKELLAYRRSENDAARDSYKVALETAAMWAALIVGVLLTVVATILTGGLALGPVGMMAIGGVTMLLSAHAQAAVKKSYLGDEYDTKNAKEDITKEVMTGLVTMGTSFFAAGLLSTVGKGARLFQQAGAARQVLQKPPSIWGVFLREASEEVASEGMDNVVEAHLEATNPEHWVDGFKVGAKRARAASDAILARADDDMFAAAVTSLVTAGVGKMKKGKGKPDFEKPTSGRKREVNIKRNLKMVFGDPEEKFTAAGIEWLLAQQQNGSIDWDNAPEELLKGLLQEYKESVHEVHGHYAHQGGKARKIDRHLAKHGSHLQNQTEVDLFKEINTNVGDTEPFVTAHDFARIRTEVAVAGLQAHEGAHGPLTDLQRDAFIQHVRKAPNTEELHRRAKSNPLEVEDVKYADARAKPNTAIGKPIASEETAREVMRELADGKKEALGKLGLAVPPDFDPTKNEWGLGKHVDVATGEVSYVLIRGEAGAVNWEGFPGLVPIAHSHPDFGPNGQRSNHLKRLDPQGGVDVRTLCATDGADRVHFLPSGADLVFVLRHGIPEHTVFTPFQSLGGGRVGNPTPGSNSAGVNIVIKNPQPDGFMFGNPNSPVARVEIEIFAGGERIHTMTLWGSDHLGGSHLWHQKPPSEQVGPADTEAFGGGEAAPGPRRTPSARRDDGPVPSDIHARPTIQGPAVQPDPGPAQTDPSQRPTVQVPAQQDPSERPTGQFPAVNPSDRPTGQFPAVDPNQIGAPPDMVGVVEPAPSGNRPARRDPQQRVINRSAVTVFDDLPQLGELESMPGELMTSGGHVLRRAQHALQAMSDQDYLGFKALLASQPSPVARAFLFKAVAAGNTMDAIYWLSDEISMQDDAWMVDHLTLGDPRQAGGGLTQQWSTSCNAATTLMLRGNYDPVFSLRFRQANGAGPVAGAHQAQLEQQMLESQYGGNWLNVPPQGHAVPHGMPGGIGRAADDLLNQQSAQTGLEFTPHVPPTQADAVATIDDRLRDGMQVPVILGNDRIGFMHYVLAMQRRETPAGVEFQIHDPGGETRWIAAADIAAGRADLFGYSKISGLDLPSDIHSPADVTTAEGGAPGSRRRDDDNQTQNQDLTEGEKTEKQEQKGRGLPTFAVKLTDIIRGIKEIDEPTYNGIEFWVKLPNGRDHSLGFGGISLDVRNGEPTGDPSFSLDASVTVDGTEYAVKLFDDVVAGEGGRAVGTGEQTPLTKLALLQYIEHYKQKFKREPDTLGGSLAFHNKLFFQQEFFKNRQKGMTTDEAALAAVKSISYGVHRADADVGYGDFEVFIDRTSYEDVALGKDKNGTDLGTQNVPTKIEVVARKSKPEPEGDGGPQGPAHPGPGGVFDWFRRRQEAAEDSGSRSQAGPQDQGNAQEVGGVTVVQQPAPPADTALGSPQVQNLARELGELLQRDPDAFIARYRQEMAVLEDEELAQLNKLLRTQRMTQVDESRLDQNQIIERHKKRLMALREIGAFEQMSFHGTRSEMVEGLSTTGGEILPAAELQNRGLTMTTGEGNKFTPNAQPKEFVSIGHGDSGFGTSMAYADASQQLAHYNVKLMPYDQLAPRIERLDFIIANYDSIDVAVQGPMRQMVAREKFHFIEERDKLARELARRDALPADSPARAGGQQSTDNYPIMFEFDLAGSTLRNEARGGTTRGGQLGGEYSFYGPIDLKSRCVRVYAPAAKLGEVRDRLRAIFGHDDFEVIALEAVDAVSQGDLGGSRTATLKMLAEMEQEWEYIERTYAVAAREQRTVDMMLYFQQRMGQ